MRIFRAPLLALLVLGAVSGCSAAPPSSGQNQSPAEAQRALFAVLDDAQQLAGGDWETADSPSPRSCTLPGSGDDGVTFSGRRLRNGPGPSAGETDSIVASLERSGFEVGRATIGEFDNVRAVMPGDEAYYVLLEAGDRVTVLSGQAACAVGDIYDELQRVKSGG